MSTPLSTTTATELTAEQVQKILVEPLNEASVFLSCGPKIFDVSGPLRLPKNKPVNAEGFTWVGENELIPEREFDFGEIQMMPSTMKSLKVITRFSNELARQSIVSIDSVIKSRLVADVAAKLDTQFFSDQGDGVTTPRGLFAYEGTQNLNVAGPINTDALLDAWGLALSANVNTSSLKWLTTPTDFVALRKLKDKQGRYILNADPTADATFRLFGCPVVISSRIPDKTTDQATGRAALVDFSQIAVARDLAPSVKLLSERYADYDQQALRVVARYDAHPLNPEAVIVLEGIKR